ncbi:hypothetical protein HOF78_02140 [Candidatus Woesearchaeota archaeon]|jgi:hypothetical protein|nr:hypothetical protein [Candidatus Woesearchaeota archaeon]
MKIRKTENHHMLLLPVLLILAAAFLATSMTGTFRTSGNEITGASVNSVALSRCGWNEPPSSGKDAIGNNSMERTRYCPYDKPVIVSGGCESDNDQAYLTFDKPELTRYNGTQGWSCGQYGSNNGLNVDTLCCRI